MNKISKYSSTLKKLKKEYKKVALQLRKIKQTKEACENAGYLAYYPHILLNISENSDNKSIIKKDIRVYSKLLKEEIKNEQTSST
jgi:hypothetical protein